MKYNLKLERNKEGKYITKNARIVKLIVIIFVMALVLAGIAYITKAIADWGAKHQIVGQRVVTLDLKWPWRVEDIEQEIIIQPVVEYMEKEEFTPIEQKIIDIWGYKDGIVAIAIFDCGESHLDQYAVSSAGALGIAQVHWPAWKTEVEKVFGYNAKDMFDVDKNLEVAYWIWDRGDGVEGNGEGSWNPWDGYTLGGYLKCFR